MKLKLMLLILVVLVSVRSFAQSSLTIFSEDGDKFYLVLNGQKQNTMPQTNVRIDGLSQPYYSAKILFEDRSKPEIAKNIPVQDPSTNAMADVTYKIKRTNSGELKIRYYSATPVQPNYVAPPDVYVMHYGQPAPPPPGTTITQTTVTTTNAAPDPGNGSISISAPGVNMNVNIADPNMNQGTTQTTTTTTYTTTEQGYAQPANNMPPPRREHHHRQCEYPMDGSSFKSAKETIAKSSFDETRVSTAKTILSSNCVSAEQVMQICKLFSFEASKLDFAKFAYAKTTDQNNYFKVGGIFDFDASKTELNDYISSNGGR